MERKIIITKDGSHSIAIPGMNVTYHSVHGAIQESMHVFIEAGFLCVRPLAGNLQDLKSGETASRVLEMGFGTGLNALLTLIEADKQKNRIYYTAIELYPLNEAEIGSLNYCEQLNQPHYKRLFEKMHQGEWEEMFEITDYFRLTKIKCSLLDFSSGNSFFLIYFDAFAPDAQPELWTKEVFEKLYNMMTEGGRLVTYCSKGDVRRAMQAAGFNVVKLPGPAGKREMLRASR